MSTLVRPLTGGRAHRPPYGGTCACHSRGAAAHPAAHWDRSLPARGQKADIYRIGVRGGRLGNLDDLREVEMSIVVDTTRDLDTGVTTVRLDGLLTFAAAPTVRTALAKCASECPTAVVV